MRKTLQERFWEKVDKNGANGCWLWVASLNNDGYGQFWGKDRMRKAHRVSYELVRGEIPKGLELDHLCKIRHCINPDHLEPVTYRENQSRSSQTILAIHRARDFCPQGHPLEGDNLTMDHLKRGWRNCLTCNRERSRQWYRDNKPRYNAWRRAYNAQKRVEKLRQAT